MRLEYGKWQVPSAPIVDVTVSGGAGETLEGRGKIDTGSDATVIPEYMVRQLGLAATGTMRIEGAFGERDVPSYQARMGMYGAEFKPIAAASLGRLCVIVGRDLLDLCHVILDGKNEMLEIVPWSTDPVDLMR